MGKKGSELSKNLRQEMVLTFMERFGRYDGLTTRQVHELLVEAHIETSFRTTLRDLEELSLYYPIAESGETGERRWMWARRREEEREINDMRYRHLKEFMDYFARLRSEAA